MIVVPDPIELVTQIRKAVTERELSINDIISLMKEKGEYPVAPATISRLLSGDEGEANYDYLKTVIPVYNTLFDIDDVPGDNEQITAMKVMLEYKKECIEDLKAQLENQKVEYLEKLEKEREYFQTIMDFRNNQISLKDERITQLMNEVEKLIDHVVNCPYKGKC